MNFNEVNNELTKSKHGRGSLNNKNNASSRKYLVVFGIFALVIATTAASFAFFSYSRVGQTTTTVTSGDIEFTYKEGEDAGLANAFPISDEVGAQDESEEYTFTVNMKSSSDKIKMNYNVYLVDNNTGSDNYFNNEQIKFALLKENVYVAGTSSTSGLKLSEIDGFSKGTHKGEGLVLDNQEITSEQTDTYKLRIWISDDVSYTNITGNDGEMIGKYNAYKYSLKVKVTSDVDNSIEINEFERNGKTITTTLVDTNGLDSYAVTTSSTTPTSDSSEWIKVTNTTGKSNVKRTADSIITTKEITFKVEDRGTYYLHVKNKLNQIKTKTFIIDDFKDKSGANEPLIKTGMIPVTYDGNSWVKADTADVWYDYDQQWWANAVTVSETSRQLYMDAEEGTPISMDDINTMWVWVPRYEYETITSTTATEIKVNFLKGTESNKTSNYITHPGFTFGDKSLTGMWVAKFEASSDTACTPTTGDIDTGCDVTTLKVKVIPGVTAWRGIRVSTMDLNTRAMNDSGNIYGFLKSEVDTHVTKNIEWGAVAYLSQSKYGKYGNSNYEGANKEIYQNKSSEYITGMSNGTPSQSETNEQVTYDVEGTGTGASTTGNIYGIYDMSGGAVEYAMGVMKYTNNLIISGTSSIHNSGFSGIVYYSNTYKEFTGRSLPDKKYYDTYNFETSTNSNSLYLFGEAINETKSWYGDNSDYGIAGTSWFLRSGGYYTAEISGIFTYGRRNGSAYDKDSFRPVLVEQ